MAKANEKAGGWEYPNRRLVFPWRAWQDSNPQPLGPKPSALSIELQAQFSRMHEHKKWGEQRDSNP